MNNKGKKLREYLGLPYTVILRRDDEGDFIARVKELEGCVADGQDEMEALANLNLVKELWLQTAIEAEQDIPKPEQEDDALPSGKFVVRVPRTLHKKLNSQSKHEGVSLNQLVVAFLAEAIGQKSANASLERGHVLETVHGSEYGEPRNKALLRLVPSNEPISSSLQDANRGFLKTSTPGTRSYPLERVKAYG